MNVNSKEGVKMKRKLHIGTVAIAAATMMGTLLETTVPASADQNSKSTFSMVFNLNDGHGLDPDLSSWEQYLDDEGIFEGLVLPGGSNLNSPRPGIATSWTSNAKKTMYTFTLRKNAKFSNGDPVIAKDFVYSMQRAVNPQSQVGTGQGGATISNLPILNALQIRAGFFTVKYLGVSAINNTTLQIKLSRPDANFVRDLTLPTSGWVVPLDPKVVNKMQPQDWSDPTKIVSDGPYEITWS
jgi:oligopeptide transport system substrate-binding protein